MSTTTLARRRPGRVLVWVVGVGLAGVGLAGVVAFIALAPTWLMILTVLSMVVAGSVWATRPPEVGMGRHVLALLGQVVLDVLRTVLRAVVGVAVVVALLVASWSYIGPRISAQVGQWRDQAVTAVTPSLELPSLHLPWTENDK